jgi:predicted dinucleotide-binding enzyme
MPPGPHGLHDDMTTFGIIGAGHIGSNVARAVIAHGHDVVIANSRGPETLADLVAELGPRARAATAEDAGTAGEVVVVAVPLGHYRDVPVEPLAGKIVLDANNYYHERDGRIPELDRGEATTSGLLQAHLPGSKVAKAFNHILAREIPTTGTPSGTPDRRALATASDFPDAAAFVEKLYDELGFDTVDVGPLEESWRVERDRPAYVVRQNRDELVANLARGTRTV